MAEGSSHAYDEKSQAIADATRRKQTAKKKFNKLSQVCVAADQVRLRPFQGAKCLCF